MTEANTPLVINASSALDVARRLAVLADEWDLAFATRVQAAKAALAAWEGEHSRNFALREFDERIISTDVTRQLREEADDWARAWAQVVDRQRRQQWEATLSSGTEAHEPQPVAVPVGPAYQPTVHLGGAS